MHNNNVKTWAPVLLFALLMGSVAPLAGQTVQEPRVNGGKTTFAIVVDARTAAAVANEIDAYRSALEAKGLGTYLVAHDWTRPEEIRSILQALHARKPRLEGAVLVGDIPIPMIRDAQHLTSIFKMNQRVDWKRSSVPSDRFYDDFDLKFSFIKRDSTERGYFYYSLDADSPHEIRMDIYTARIKPPLVEGKDAHTQIGEYLAKAARQHRTAPMPLRTMASYSGHGYHSESMDAWAAERMALKEELPQLFVPGGKSTFLNFRMDPMMKHALLNTLQDGNTDLVVLHHHGSDDLQLINGYPYVSNPQPSIDNIKRYLRNKIQDTHSSGGDVEARKRYFHEWLGVPIAWMDDAIADSVLLADSLLNASTDIHIADLRRFPPGTPFVLLDACDNGAFHRADYIAAHYPFGEGENIAVFANSVGVAQDLWANEHLGLLAYGVRLGHWLKQVAYLESHLFGDPAFAYAGSYDADLNEALAYPEAHRKTWRGGADSGIPAIESLALKQFYWQEGVAASARFRRKVEHSPYAVVRQQALLMLNRLDDANYHDALLIALRDPHELTRRFAITMVGEHGGNEWLPEMVRMAVHDRYSERIQSKLRQALAVFPPEEARKALDAELAASPRISDIDLLRERIAQTLNGQQRTLEQQYQATPADFSDTKALASAIRTLRGYRYHQAIPFVIAVISKEDAPEEIKVAGLEALAWFGKSYRKDAIIAHCQSWIDDPGTAGAVRTQALKTKAILEYNQRF